MKFKIQNLKFKISTIGYLISIIGLFFYSFTQVDLSLTLSQWSIWQTIQIFFQQIGYFQRPLSSLLFFVIISSLFIFYLTILYKINKKMISKKTIWFLIIASTTILNFSYNAFSYDLFNYIFDAKIVTFYNQNPYLHKALDFPGDPMLSFMHWTHRVYPYGPTWLAMTVPLSFLGFQFFLPTFFLFKTLISICFLGTVFFIGKILQKTSVNNEVFGIAFFALNPLVIVESLVSSHNDISMMLFSIWATYLLMSRKYIRSILLLIISIGVKFASVVLLPLFLIIYFYEKQNKKISWNILFSIITLIMIIPIILASQRTNFQPWYLLFVLPFASLVSNKYYFFIPSIFLSLFAIMEYLPFLYFGNWDNPIPIVLFWMLISAVLVSGFLILVWFFKLRLNNQVKMIK